jgi:hypothetical protein
MDGAGAEATGLGFGGGGNGIQGQVFGVHGVVSYRYRVEEFLCRVAANISPKRIIYTHNLDKFPQISLIQGKNHR